MRFFQISVVVLTMVLLPYPSLGKQNTACYCANEDVSSPQKIVGNHQQTVKHKTPKEKYFKEALKRGRADDSFYHAVIAGNKKVTIEKIEEKCKEYNLLLGDIKTKSVNRFGEIDNDAVGEFEFLPAEELESYYFAKYRFASYDKFNALKFGVFAKLPNRFPINGKIITHEVGWSGSTTVGGLIDGDGNGIVSLGAEGIVIFKGFFDHGYPKGLLRLKVVHYNGLTLKSVEDYSSIIKPISDGVICYEYKGRFGYINEDGLAIQPIYSSASDFKDGNAVVSLPCSDFSARRFSSSGYKYQYKSYDTHNLISTGNVEFIIDKRGNFIDFSLAQKERFDESITAIELKKEQERLAEEERKRQEEIRLANERAEQQKREREHAKKVAEEKRLINELKGVAERIAEVYEKWGACKAEPGYYWYKKYSITVPILRYFEPTLYGVLPNAEFYKCTEKREFFIDTWLHTRDYLWRWGNYYITLSQSMSSGTIIIYVCRDIQLKDNKLFVS